MRRLIVSVIIVILIIINTGCEIGKKENTIDGSQKPTGIIGDTSGTSIVADDSHNVGTSTVTSLSDTSSMMTDSRPGFYINSKYGFYIHYPIEWVPSDESPAGDGLVLYKDQGENISVYGGYNIDNSVNKELEGYKSVGLAQANIITDEGQKGTLISGKYQGKILFHFIICGKEMQCQFYALVTSEFYDKNKNTLLKTVKQLFLDENPISPDKQDNDRLNAYKKYLEALPSQHIRNIKLAENAYNSLVTEDKSFNDKLFRLFREYYDSVVNETDGYYTDNGEIYGDMYSGEKLPESLLSTYGLRNNWSESGDYIADDPKFLVSHFASTLTDGLMEFLSIRQKQYEEYPATYLIEDAALSISWDQLSDNIIEWETYISKYPSYSEAKEAEDDLDFYLKLYLLDFNLDNTPMFVNGKLSNELQQSYARFIKLYKDSKYCKIIKGYYDILKSNNFKLTENAVDFLAENEIMFGDTSANSIQIVPNLNLIKEIMPLAKEQVLDKLGYCYEIVEAGAEGQEEGYYYLKYGMTIIFDNTSSLKKISYVVCNEKVDVSGAKVGMSFDEIKKYLGEGQIRKLVQNEPDQPLYALYYSIDDFMVWFGAPNKNDKTTDLQIRLNN